MGVIGLIPAVKAKDCKLEDLKNLGLNRVAVDVSCFIYRAIKTNVYKCVTNKIASLVRMGFVPTIVFDGDAPDVKGEVLREREASRAKNKSMVVRTAELQGSIKQFCKENGIAYCQAPFEADAQIIYLLKMNMVDFVISDDSDFILYEECKYVVFKFYDNKGEFYQQNNFQDAWKAPYNEECLRAVCICRGSDYFPKGVFGIGMGRAKEIYRELLPKFTIQKLIKILRRRGMQLPAGFVQSFEDAMNTFRHQPVIDPDSGTFAPLTPYPPGKSHIDYLFAGNLDTAEGEYWKPPEDLLLLPTRPLRLVCMMKGCTDTFSSEQERVEHQDAAHPKTCDICERTFPCPYELLKHRIIHGITFKCNTCAEVFWTELNLESHTLTEHSGETAKCPHCGKEISTRILGRHVIDCSKPKKAFPCKLCQSSFDTFRNLDAHMRRIHKITRRATVKKPFSCRLPECPNSFNSERQLNSHMRTVHGIKKRELIQKPFRCSFCLYSFDNQRNLTKHVQRKHPEAINQESRAHD